MLGRVTTPQNLDERFRDAVSALPPPGARRPAERRGPRRHGAHRRPRPRALRRPARQPPPRPRRPLAAQLQRGLLHDRLRPATRATRRSRPRSRRPTRPCCTTDRARSTAPAPVSSTDAARDVLRGVVASAQEPIAGGRHKVVGSAELNIIPTTSTVASHLPRAVGLAFSLVRPARRAAGGRTTPSWSPRSATPRSTTPAPPPRSTRPAGTSTRAYGCRCCWSARTTGSGVSVPSPDGWVAAVLDSRPGLRYSAADGCDLAATYDAATEAADYVRRERRPAVLHLSMVRLMGHAGRRRRGRATGRPTRSTATWPAIR